MALMLLVAIYEYVFVPWLLKKHCVRLKDKGEHTMTKLEERKAAYAAYLEADAAYAASSEGREAAKAELEKQG